MCSGIGWQNVSTYIQSGNIGVRRGWHSFDSEKQLTDAIAAGSLVIASMSLSDRRPPLGGPLYLREINPFPEVSEAEPNRGHAGAVEKTAGNPMAGREPQQVTLPPGESIAQRTDSLWIHYASGSAKTKISPALLDRLVGSPVTTRNWRTVLKIGDMPRLIRSRYFHACARNPPLMISLGTGATWQVSVRLGGPLAIVG